MKTKVKEQIYNQIIVLPLLQEFSTEDKSEIFSFCYNQFRIRNDLRKSKDSEKVVNVKEEKPVKKEIKKIKEIKVIKQKIKPIIVEDDNDDEDDDEEFEEEIEA